MQPPATPNHDGGFVEEAAALRLYVGGLKAEITPEDVAGRFRPFGEVSGVELSLDKANPASKSYVIPAAKCVNQGTHQLVAALIPSVHPDAISTYPPRVPRLVLLLQEAAGRESRRFPAFSREGYQKADMCWACRGGQ